jgi:DNA-binding LacI/PurR family transcriptional regulator
MTVSLSLRDDTSISEATRTRVKKIAEEMGYRRDPLLSAYGQQIRRRKS